MLKEAVIVPKTYGKRQLGHLQPNPNAGFSVVGLKTKEQQNSGTK